MADFERWRIALEEGGQRSTTTTKHIRKLKRKLARKDDLLPMRPKAQPLRAQIIQGRAPIGVKAGCSNSPIANVRSEVHCGR